MNRLSKPQTLVPSNSGGLGPGRLVLVVGPSGAGKDTLLKGARAACAYDPAVVFPRRVVTRPKSDAEDHDTMDADAFRRAADDRAFALWWHAHGNGYGIPSSIDRDIRAGRTVVCNVSRTVVDTARERYGFVTVVEITAPEQVLQSRLALRQRVSDGNIAERIERSAEVERLYAADIVIRNVGRPDGGVRRLIRAIRTKARSVRRALAKF
ncbi:MAG: phosphonate metabolism protein/1,5-bisphosphokinase (PRPP-forming) PhnN [Xanthobacteraceae bacterium]